MTTRGRVVIPSGAPLLGGAEGFSTARVRESMADGCWFCYMLRCKDGSLYVGVAKDVAERVKEHNWGVGAKFTSKRRPVQLIWCQTFPDQKGARGRERKLKGWRREKKLKLLLDIGDRVYPSAAKAAASG